MKNFFFAALLIPSFAFSQSDQKNYYGNVFGSFLLKSYNAGPSLFGGGVAGGIKIKNIGLGLNAELFKINNDLATGFPISVDVRYFFKENNNADKLKLFAALNLGKFIWTAQKSFGGPSDNTTEFYKGTFNYAIETGVIVPKIIKKNGLLFSVGFRNYDYKFNSKRTTIRGSSGQIIPESTTFSPSFKRALSNIALKVGLQF